jgi:hypothetical protein
MSPGLVLSLGSKLASGLISLYSLSIRAFSYSFLTSRLPFLVLPYYHFFGTSYFFWVRLRYRFGRRPEAKLSPELDFVFPRRDGPSMATQQDLMTKKITTEGLPKRPSSNTERRGSRRCRITQLMRIRPSDPNLEHFEDMRGTTSVSRSGVYFQSSEVGYEVGMRLFVTMPFSQDPAAMNREYLAEVVRRDILPTGMYGIGFKILMEMGIQHTYHFGGGAPSR